MGFFSFGRIVGAFFNQLFRWLFWNKTGQKILFTIVIAVILVAFVKLGEVAAVEPDNFSTYEEIDFDGSLSNSRIDSSGKLAHTDSVSFVYYVELNPYNYYSLYYNDVSSTRNFRYGFTDSLDIGSTLSDYTNIDVSSGDSGDCTFSGDNGHKYFLVFVNSSTADIKLYYNAFPYEVLKLSLPGWTNLGSVGYMYRYSHNSTASGDSCAFPIVKGFSYRLTGTASSSFGFVTDLDFLNSSSDRDWSYSSNTTGSTRTEERVYYSTFNGTVNSDINCVDFVAPSTGYLIMTDYGNLEEKLFSSSLDTSVVNNSSSVNQNINQSTNAINNVNDSLTDSSISDSNEDYVLPESGVNDIAESGFANIFDKLRNAFTQESSGQGLVVQVPFTDKSFTISKNSVFGNAELGIVGTLINSFWYFLISLWIVKDIAHKMNMIKSGNIELAQTSNIKEDLL